MIRKRINIICNYASIYGGNFIPSLLCLCEELKSNSTVILTFPEEAKDRQWISYIKEKGFGIFFLKDFFSKQSRRKFKEINKEHGINTIYSHFISGLKLKLLYAFDYKMKIRIHIHSDWRGNKKASIKQRIASLIEYHLIRTDALYIFVSESLYKTQKIKHKFFVPNALCLNRVPFAKFDKKGFMARHNIKSSDTIFLLFGWAPFIKGLDIAVKAFLNIPLQLQSRSKFIIVHKRGNGLNICINYLKESLGTDDFLQNKNIIFTEPIEDIFGLYELSDVFISASRSEGFSYSLAESIYFNLICFVSNIDGTMWAKQYQNCYLYHLNDYGELSSLMKDKIGVKKLAIKNQKILMDYNIMAWSKSLLDIL